jgi:hypothetical protein
MIESAVSAGHQSALSQTTPTPMPAAPMHGQASPDTLTGDAGLNGPAAVSATRDAYIGVTPSTRSTVDRVINKLDHLDRQFVRTMSSMPDVNMAEAGTPEGLMKLAGELLKHQASLTHASIGVSMVSTGTTSFRDGVKQVLTQQ